MLNPTPYPNLNTVLNTFTTSLRHTLADNLVGLYLVGSFSLGDFDRNSDVDFIAVTERELNGAEQKALQTMHADIYDSLPPWSTHLEGSYVSAARWRRFNKPAAQLYYLDNGAREFTFDDHCNTRVVRRAMRQNGIALYGPSADSLIDPIPDNDLRNEMLETMGEWLDYLNERENELDNGWLQPHTVIAFCRMLHTLETAKIDTKLAACTWAKQSLDPKWHDLITHAWSQRPDPVAKSRQPADPERVPQTRAFIDYAFATAEARLST